MTEVDLMEDVGFDTGWPLDLVLHITKANGHFAVIINGTKADGLAWDEMLGQIVALTHPRMDGRAHYSMSSREDFVAKDERRQRKSHTKDQQQ